MPKAIDDCNSNHQCLMLQFDELYQIVITIPTKTLVNEDGFYVETSWDTETDSSIPVSSFLNITFTPYLSISK